MKMNMMNILRRHQLIVTILLALAITLSFSGCSKGGGGDSGPPPETISGQTPTETSSDPTPTETISDPTPTSTEAISIPTATPIGPGAGKTTITGGVTLSSTVSAAPSHQAATYGGIFHAISQGGALSGADVKLYDADRPEWRYPVARTTADTSGVYTLEVLTNASLNRNADNSAVYVDGDPIPSGNYTIIASNDITITGGKQYVAVQAYVKKFDGAVTGNDLVAYNSNQVPEVVSMFGVVDKNVDGTFGSPDYPLAGNAAIQITFNMAMARISVLNAMSIKDGSGLDVDGKWKVSADLLSATFYPAYALSVGDVYSLSVSSDAQSVYGTAMSAPVNGFFLITAADDTPPNAAKCKPEAQTDVPITTRIQIKANEALDVNTFVITATPSIGDKPAVFYVGKSNDVSYPFVYEIKSAGGLQLNTNYAITIGGAKDMAGNVISAVTINFKTIAAADTTPPVTKANPPGGPCIPGLTVMLTTDEDAKIFFTTDGSTPTTSSPVYLAPLGIKTSTTLKFFAKDTAGNEELVKTETYTIDTSAVDTVIDSKPNNPTNSATATFTFTSNKSGATFECSFDGAGYTPCVSPAIFSTSNQGNHKFYVKAIDSTMGADTTPASFYWMVDLTAPTTATNPVAGSFTAPVNVSLSANEAATIYYTRDGSTPTINSSTYSGAIAINSTTTLKYFAVDTVGNSEAVKSSSFTIQLPTMPMEGLVAHYPFLGDARDIIGKNDGVLVNKPAFTFDRNKNAAGALDLNGINQYIELPNEAAFDLTSFTLYAIVSVPDYANTAVIINKPYGEKGYGNYCMEVLPSTAGGNAGKAGYVHDISTGNWSYLITSSRLPLNTYKHLAVTVAAGVYTSYQDGIAVYTTSGIPKPVVTDSPVIIGAHLGFGMFFKGAIDEALIYNRALDEKEINQLYNAMQ